MSKNKLKNDVWEKVWKKYHFDPVVDAIEINWEQSQPRWQCALYLFNKQFCGLKNKAVVELGCGRATEALLCARQAAKVTLVDKNKKALELARQRFKYYGLEKKLEIVQSDVLRPDKKLLGKFDISMSLGLAEHFSEKNRQKVITTHAEVLKNKGLAMISVPNRWSIPYRIWMKREQLFGQWQYGLEIPYSPTELKEITIRAKLQPIFLVGSSVINDVLVLFLPPRFRRIRSFIRLTPFDSKFGHILTIFAKRT